MHGSSQGTPVPLSTFGGLATLASPESLPEGVSPRNWDMDFTIGGTRTRDGLKSVYTYSGAAVGPNPGASAIGSGWTNPRNILANDGSVTSITFSKPVFGRTPPTLVITEFGFDLPTTASITGVEVEIKGKGNAPGLTNVSLMLNGFSFSPIKTVGLTTTESTMTFGSVSDMWGTALTHDQVNNLTFGVQIYMTSNFNLGTAFLDYVTITVGITTGAANFNWIGTFTDQDGTVRNLSQDANGDLWVENVTTAPGVLSLALDTITPKSFANGVNGQGVEYLAFSNLLTGSDIPRQYTSQWIDRITQVGPGASPVFRASSAQATTYNISTITQPVGNPPPTGTPGTALFAFGLQSAGPGSNTPGNVITQYYADSTLIGPDQDLVNAFNSGNPTYVHVQNTPASGGDTIGTLPTPYTALVTSVGLAKPNGQSRPFYYFTYQAATTGFVWNAGNASTGYRLGYQRTLATITMAQPVPQLTVGDQVLITGDSVSAWNTTWPITQTLNSGSMVITQTTLSSGGVGTYSYSVVSGANPTVGQLVTITGTLNADGALNVVNVAIASVAGTSVGTFTINLLPAGTDWPAEAEEGQAVTAGTEFTIDPGILTLGTNVNPIYGNGTGGSFSITGSGQTMGAGTRQGVCFFITRNGYWTCPSAPVIFTTPENTTAILASNIPIGPPNVIARGIAFTEAGQNGVPGANFFTIPTSVKYTVQNVTYTATALIINDNTTTSASFFFTDDVLLNAEAIDVQGQNLFNLIEIGNPAWIVQYASRNFYGLCQNKVQNFTNLSFDGGFINPDHPVPLGWTVPDQYGSLAGSPIFGNSYYIVNSTGITQNNYGQIFQNAYQDAYQQPIIQPNTTYSIRVTCRNPSGLGNGNLDILLLSQQGVKGQWIMLAGSMTTSMQTFTAPFVTTPMATVPTDLQLTVYGANFHSGVDVEIDRIEIFPTEIPVLTTTVLVSYANDFESVDAVTGAVEFLSENQQPVYGATVLYDTFYANKESSKYALRSSANLEPAQWSVTEVSQKSGSCGINAFDSGEQWEVAACRNGVYLYEGGQPGKIMQEIWQVWDSLNWSHKQCIWVKNDVTSQRMFIGVPMPTPNFWLPNAPVNANPTTPNVILMCNYQGVETGEGIKSESSLHVTMFGNLESGDMRRKWSIWNIPSPYGAIVKTGTDEAIYICNGNASSKMYQLDPTMTTDDGVAISSLYMTYGFVNLSKTSQLPMLGAFRKRWGYMTSTVSGSGTLQVRFLPNVVLGPNDDTTGYNPSTVPGGFILTPVCLHDREASLNVVATRTFVEFSGNDFDLNNLTLYGNKDSWNALLGKK